MPILLIKYLPHLIIAVLIIGGLGFAGSQIHKNGRQLERGLWLEWKQNREKKEAKLVAIARANVRAEIEKQNQGLMEVINAQATLNNQLESDMHALSNQRMFIRAKPARCDSNGLPTQADNSSESGNGIGGTNLVELSGQDARAIRDDYRHDARLANQCKVLLLWAKNNADVVGVDSGY